MIRSNRPTGQFRSTFVTRFPQLSPKHRDRLDEIVGRIEGLHTSVQEWPIRQSSQFAKNFRFGIQTGRVMVTSDIKSLTIEDLKLVADKVKELTGSPIAAILVGAKAIA